MKLDDFIKDRISKYPYLYAYSTYEISRLEILNYLFFVIGNGMEWAKTRSKKSGGYLVIDRFKEKNGEYVRIMDQPYGKEKYDGSEIDRFFTELYVAINEIDPKFRSFPAPKTCIIPVWKGFISEIPEDIVSKCICKGYSYNKKLKQYEEEELSYREIIIGDDQFKSFSALPLNLINPEYVIDACNFSESKRIIKPSPFNETSWAYAKIDPKLIQKDWLQGMIDIKKFALQYYWNESYQYKEYKVNSYVKAFELYANDKTIKELLCDYGLTFEDLPHWEKLEFSELTNHENIKYYAECFDLARYKKDQKNRISILQKAIETLEAAKV